MGMNCKMGTVSILLFCLLLNCAYGSNILVMTPTPAFNHTHTYMPIFKELARRGHNVTVVTPFPQNETVANFKQIILPNILTKLMCQKISDVRNVRGFFMPLFGLRIFCEKLLDTILKLPELQDFLKDTTSNYDLVIVESFFCQEPFLALGHKYGAPVVVVLANSNLGPSVSEISGNTFSSSYIPNVQLGYSNRMTFLERFMNVIMNSVDYLFDRAGWIYMDYCMRQQFSYPGFEKLPPLTDMMKNVSLYLIESHISLNYPRPLLPNVIEFDGLSVNSGDVPPRDLEGFMNDSHHGVILFSWESHYKSTTLISKLTSVFLPVFAKLEQRILMKWENETLPGKPDNVKTVPWLPQASLLAHPNARVLISDGGIHEVSEAIYNGVPLLGTPLFGDNYYNFKLAEEGGFGLNVDIDTVTQKELFDALNKLLTIKSFSENAVKRSLILRDHPKNTLENAVYWVEYVIRHNGASHLRPGSSYLSWYEYWMLDVIAAFFVLLVLSLALLKCLLKGICLMFRKKPNSAHKRKEKKLKKH